MKKVFLGLVLVSAAMPVENITTQSPHAAVEGMWSARVSVSDREGADTTPTLQIQMNVDTGRNGGWNNWGQSMPLSAFTGLPQNLNPRQGVRFELRRDAGVVSFDGRFENERGVGTMTFTPNREFARVMEQQTSDTFTDRELFSFAVLDVSRAFVAELQALGFRDVTLADARKLRIHGVTPSFAKDMAALGYGDAGFRQLRTFRIHGVTPAFVRDMASLGYKGVDADTLVKFRIHGITPSFVRELADAGDTNLSEKELVDWAIHGRRLLKTRKR